MAGELPSHSHPEAEFTAPKTEVRNLTASEELTVISQPYECKGERISLNYGICVGPNNPNKGVIWIVFTTNDTTSERRESPHRLAEIVYTSSGLLQSITCGNRFDPVSTDLSPIVTYERNFTNQGEVQPWKHSHRDHAPVAFKYLAASYPTSASLRVQRQDSREIKYLSAPAVIPHQKIMDAAVQANPFISEDTSSDAWKHISTLVNPCLLYMKASYDVHDLYNNPERDLDVVINDRFNMGSDSQARLPVQSSVQEALPDDVVLSVFFKAGDCTASIIPTAGPVFEERVINSTFLPPLKS